MLVPTTTNQLFPILPDGLLAQLEQEFTFVRQKKMGDGTTAVRFCTSWATTEENLEKLCLELRNLTKSF